MKWYHSIIAKITVVFGLALVAIVAVFISLFNHDEHKEISQMQELSRAAMRSSYDATKRDLDPLKMQEMGFILVKDPLLKEKILSLPKPPNLTVYPMRQMQDRYRMSVAVIPHGIHLYALFEKRDGGETPIFQTPYEKELFPKLLIPFAICFLLIVLYAEVIRRLLPLYKLKEEIKSFASGNYDITCKSAQKDEIGALANEFDTAVHKIKALRDARVLFLRNIMHELKTPITKGKLATEMLEQNSYTTVLHNAFRRQETLLEEFTRIEKLSADELVLDIKPYHIEDVVDCALDILEDKKEHITCKLFPVSLSVDFDLFSVALKNLLDNGMNYSSDGKVSLINDAHTITISNKGTPLEFPLERYSEPYFLEGKKQKSARGLGFGLFITWHVVRLHEMKMDYYHKEGINFFTISF